MRHEILYIQYSDFAVHILVISIITSLIAPFGGFFASAFKRNLNIKDFSDTIPGHGGVTDRLDCVSIMAIITPKYLNFIK